MNKNKTMLQINEVKMKSTKEKIEVMQSFLNGEDIQVEGTYGWIDMLTDDIKWNWHNNDYRVKPQEPQTDWSKVAKGTAVFVSDDLTKEWKEVIFVEFDTKNKDCCYPFRYFNPKNSSSGWSIHCKLDKSAPSIINWIKNTGEVPDCDRVLVRYVEGKIMYSNVIALCFNINDSGIVEYAIIE